MDTMRQVEPLVDCPNCGSIDYHLIGDITTHVRSMGVGPGIYIYPINHAHAQATSTPWQARAVSRTCHACSHTWHEALDDTPALRTCSVTLLPGHVVNPRVDLVGHYGDGVLVSITGTPCVSPVAPHIPVGLTPVAQVLVRACAVSAQACRVTAL